MPRQRPPEQPTIEELRRRYQAIGVDRGASLDTVDYPLNNRRWLVEQFERIRKLPGESARLKALEAAAGWTDPGPGGFYDDAGNIAQQPHVVRGLPFAEDDGAWAANNPRTSTSRSRLPAVKRRRWARSSGIGTAASRVTTTD
mgnify:CR=1 FL=1